MAGAFLQFLKDLKRKKMSTARNYMRNRNDRKEKRKAENEERLEYWRSLTPKQQIQDLDRRLGKGVGAKKQRAKILAKIENESD